MALSLGMLASGGRWGGGGAGHALTERWIDQSF